MSYYIGFENILLSKPVMSLLNTWEWAWRSYSSHYLMLNIATFSVINLPSNRNPKLESWLPFRMSSKHATVPKSAYFCCFAKHSNPNQHAISHTSTLALLRYHCPTIPPSTIINIRSLFQTPSCSCAHDAKLFRTIIHHTIQSQSRQTLASSTICCFVARGMSKWCSIESATKIG